MSALNLEQTTSRVCPIPTKRRTCPPRKHSRNVRRLLDQTPRLTAEEREQLEGWARIDALTQKVRRGARQTARTRKVA